VPGADVTYFTEVEIGTPPTKFAVQIDSGSADL
jgi:cathepsin D